MAAIDIYIKFNPQCLLLTNVIDEPVTRR